MAFPPRMTRLAALAAAVLLATLSVWLWAYGRQERYLFRTDFDLDKVGIEGRLLLPEVFYRQGLHAERRMDPEAAAGFFRQAVARNPLHMDAWLRLADTMALAGDVDGARRVAAFAHRATAPVVRWKWQLGLLSQGLGMDDVFFDVINFLAERRLKINDTFFLLDTRCDADPACMLAVLAPGSRPAFLEWAIRWQRADAAGAVWNLMAQGGEVDADLLARYVHFLVSQKEIAAAQAIWDRHRGRSGMTNGDFESEMTGKGFDWQALTGGEGRWKIQRERGGGRGESYGLRVAFGGDDNVNFHHLRQVAPVIAGGACRLHFWWRSRGLTTDQLPIMEVVGYDGRGLSARSQPMDPDSPRWREAAVDFTPPADCSAVWVRLRRLPSHRFDNKIEGRLWLDDVSLTCEPRGGAAASGPTQESQFSRPSEVATRNTLGTPKWEKK